MEVCAVPSHRLIKLTQGHYLLECMCTSDMTLCFSGCTYVTPSVVVWQCVGLWLGVFVYSQLHGDRYTEVLSSH